MGKKKGGKKGKSKKSKSSLHGASHHGIPVITLYNGTGQFVMENGDSYDGEYCAHRIGIVWREGYGVYKTHDGQTYTGLWKDDVLVNHSEAIIKFPNKQQYRGRVIKNKANGPGTFTLESSMRIGCEFHDNKPVGHIVMIDVFGHIWEGQAEKNSALLFPENIFYKVLTPDCGKGEVKVPKGPRKKKLPPLPLCKSGENIFPMPEAGGYVYAKANTKRFTKEDMDYYNLDEAEEQIVKTPRQLENEFIEYERVLGMRRRYLVPIESSAVSEEISSVSGEEVVIDEESPPDKPMASQMGDSLATTTSHQRSVEDMLLQVPECALDEDEMRQIVFAKSAKIGFEGVFSYEAKYVQDYVKFRHRKALIEQKIEEQGEEALDADEKKWVEMHEAFVRQQRAFARRRAAPAGLHQPVDAVADTNLLDQFYGKEWREKCPPIVMYLCPPPGEKTPTQEEEDAGAPPDVISAASDAQIGTQNSHAIGEADDQKLFVLTPSLFTMQ